MRLLKILPGGGYGFETFDDDNPPPYAILSHRWGAEEVLYEHILDGTAKTMLGYAKLEFCGERAEADDIPYFWSDTCCINKADAAETQRSINSMYKWYQRAAKCYVYLPDVSAPDKDAEARQFTWLEGFQKSTWFTRGWTLQELLAPDVVEFYSIERNRLGDRVSLIDEIREITGLPVELLRGHDPADWSIDDRLKWAAKRTTTVKEDIVYCLLGICGVFLTIIEGEGAEYAEQRLRDEFERRRQGGGIKRLYDLPVSLRLPFPRNEVYVGREIELGLLKQILVPKSASHTHQRLTVCGLGGSGKSALALEFAYRAMTEDARLKVFWVPAISHASFELAYREIGQRLRIPGIDDDNVDVKTLVRDRLSLPSAGDWIIVVDNADDSDVLFGAVGEQKSTNLIDWLPRSSRGSILFTTRNSKMAARLTLGNQNIYLAKLGTTEAGEMLKRRITKEHLIGDETTVNELLEKLDCLPLAITQATAFINTNEVTVARYLRLFQDTSAAEIFSKKFYDNSRYGSESNVDYDGMDSTIAKTWHISFEQMRKQDPLAAEYLSFMACIDRINIPESILPLERSNTLDHLESIGTLIGYAFITRQQQTHGTGREDLYDMHRLVHMACVLWLDAHEERAPWSSKALDRLIDVVPRKGHEGRQVWILYLPHAIYVADHNPTMTDQLKAAILNRVGRCQATLGQYSAAEATHRQALQLRKKSLGEDSAFTLASMAELGQALLHQGKYAEAEAIDQQAVAGRKKVLGLEDPFTLQAMNNLAAVLRYRGKLEAAELMYTEILEVQTRVCGPQHSDTLSSKLNLGLVLKDRGKLKEAESFDREALQGWERLHGRDHPNTMTALNNLAAVLNSQGKKEEARAFAEEGFQRTMDALGEDHSETLISLNNVACMTPTGPKCELMWRDLLERRTKVLGEEHPDTITTMINLADVLDELEKDEGEEMGKKALALREKVLGFEHPDTMLCAWGLATILAHGYKFEEATVLYQRAYSGLSAKLGKDHSSTRGCRKEWDDMLAVQDSLRSPISKLTSGVKNFSFGSFKPFARQKV